MSLSLQRRVTAGAYAAKESRRFAAIKSVTARVRLPEGSTQMPSRAARQMAKQVAIKGRHLERRNCLKIEPCHRAAFERGGLPIPFADCVKQNYNPGTRAVLIALRKCKRRAVARTHPYPKLFGKLPSQGFFRFFSRFNLSPWKFP